MSLKGKIPPELKIQAVEDYQAIRKGSTEIIKELGIRRSTFQSWVRKYQMEGRSGLMGIDMQDDGEALPEASSIASAQAEAPSGAIVSLVDVDFAEYRRKNDMRVVKKNCTIPSWLNFEAERAGVNFSAVLQAALKSELHITSR